MHPSPSPFPLPAVFSAARAVVIGASTGGPQAVSRILHELPNDLKMPVFVAQHMPPEFVPDFVKSLSSGANLPVELGTPNTKVVVGHVYVAPGGEDMKIISDSHGNHHLVMEPASTSLSPSVDVLMASVATMYAVGALGIILTGMGVDGLEGMRAIKAMGGKTVVQDEATSAVYGMAQAVNKEHLADAVMPLKVIDEAIVAWGAAA